VASGANALVSSDAASLHDVPDGPGVVLTCFEVPIATVVAAVAAATRMGLPAIVNPAPAQPLPAHVLAAGVILTPNEEELLATTGSPDVKSGVASLLAAGAGAIIVTLGAKGALLADSARRRSVPARAAEVVDATGAGDTFSGVLAAWLADGHSLDEAVEAANCAAGLSVARAGARDGMPRLSAIEAALRA
jgi:ribokinase